MYAFLDENVKFEINSLIDELINSNFDFKKSYQNYMDKVNEIGNYFSDEQCKKIIKTETEKMYNLLGNKLIQLMKEYREIKAETIIFNLFEIMSRLENQEEARVNSGNYINSLSNNARKEWARRMSYGGEIER